MSVEMGHNWAQRDKFKVRRRRKRRAQQLVGWRNAHSSSSISAKMENPLKLVIREETIGRLDRASSVIIKNASRSNTAQKSLNSARVLLLIILPTLVTFQSSSNKQVEALQITRFRVPAFVPANLAADEQQLLAKPILFDCDYDFRPDEDERLSVKWFKDKEAEPFYQWLPEFNVQNFADWILPLINRSFVSDPHEPLKRYRSLLIRRLSFNLTGSYTCSVSSLGGEDSRQSSVVVYQPPRHFAFEHRIFPAPAALLAGTLPTLNSAHKQQTGPTRAQYDPLRQQTSAEQLMRQPANGLGAQRPTQFKGLSLGQQQQQQISGWPTAAIVRPPNNQQQAASTGGSPSSTTAPQVTTKIVYTHDGRPIRRERAASADESGLIASWQLRKKLGAEFVAPIRQKYLVQLVQFQCQASQLTPRPVMMLTVKRDAESIAQYLHESSVVNIRPHQVSQRALLGGSAGELPLTLYDITVSATVALNVSLPDHSAGPAGQSAMLHEAENSNQPVGVNTVLHFRRGQRMSFECHLEITGTEFERRERIFINEQEVYQLAEAEEERRRARLEHQLDPSGNQRNRASPHQPRSQSGEPAVSQDGGLLASLGLGSSASASHTHKLVAPSAAGAVWLAVLTSCFLARRLLGP